jgi:hypothetical protein
MCYMYKKQGATVCGKIQYYCKPVAFSMLYFYYGISIIGVVLSIF